MLRELTEAWGVERRTDGVRIVPNQVPIESPSSDTATLPGDRYRTVMASAVRRVTLGERLDAVVVSVATALDRALRQRTANAQLERVAATLRWLRAEEGLLGKVYLRDEVFPGLLTGKWDALLRKRCAGARYWLAKPGSKLAAYENYLGKRVVTKIPWGEAFAHYAPLFSLAGTPPSNVKAPRAALAAAFLAEPVRRTASSTTFPIQADPTSGWTTESAWAAFEATPRRERRVVEPLDEVRRRRAVAEKIRRWVRSGLLSEKDSKRILLSSADPAAQLETGASLIALQRKSRAYAGRGVGVKERSVTSRSSAWARLKEAELIAAETLKVTARVTAMVNGGSLTGRDAKAILSSGLAPREMLQVAEIRAASTRSEEPLPPLPPRRTYAGILLRARRAATSTHTATWARLKEAELLNEARRRAHGVVTSMVRSGALTETAARRILAEEDVQKILLLANAAAASPYKPGPQPTAPKRAYVGRIERAAPVPRRDRGAAWTAACQEEVNLAHQARAAAVVWGLARGGRLTTEDAELLIRSKTNPDEMLRVAEARARSTEGRAVAARQASPSARYQGVPMKRAAQETPSATVNPLEVGRLMRWASQKMNGGMAGLALDEVLRARFSEPLLREAATPLVQLRRKHEGLAGHLYVMAEAYASSSGVSGCEQGALAHRTNAIPTVLRMGRCDTCVFNVEDSCQKYNKPLVASNEIPDVEAYQAEVLRLANGTDADRTASLFAPSYNPLEYQLKNHALEEFSFDSNASTDTLSNILFDDAPLTLSPNTETR
jgi:hypothetical protein